LKPLKEDYLIAFVAVAAADIFKYFSRKVPSMVEAGFQTLLNLNSRGSC